MEHFPGGMNKFQSVADELSKYDLVVANLEAPITESCFTAECKGIHLKTTSKMIDVLKYLKVRIVSLANNHACDFGIRGLEDTVSALEAAGIKYYGVNGKSETLLVKNEPITFHGYSDDNPKCRVEICINRKEKVSGFFLWAGKQSLEIYMMHGLLLNIFKSSVAIQFSSIEGYLLTAGNFALTIGLCAVVIRLLNQNVVLKKVLSIR